jgi:hypothetical protein
MTNSRQEIEDHIPESEIHLKDMDLEVDIENIQFSDYEERVQENMQPMVELAIQDEGFSEQDLFSVRNALFDKDSRKLIFERTLSKIKRMKLVLYLTLIRFFHLESLRFIRLLDMICTIQ